MPKIVIVGGGISGLALAFRLEQLSPNFEVILIEKEPRLGGTVWSLSEDDFQIEIGPNGFLDNKPSTLALCKDVGLADRLVPASEAAGRNRFVFLNNKLRRLPTSLLGLALTNALSWRAKRDLILEGYRPKTNSHEDESLSSFFERRLSAEIAGGLADAFVTGIYAGDPKLLSARACFPRLVALEQEHGSLLRGMSANAKKRRREAKALGQTGRSSGRMWSLQGGLKGLIKALRNRLRQLPVRNAKVSQLKGAADHASTWVVRSEAGGEHQADVVVLTCPAHEQAAILHNLDATLASAIGEIAYNKVAVVALGYRQSDVPIAVEGFGYLVPQAERRDILGVQWCSSIFPDRAPPGMVLLRAMCGGWHRGDMLDWDDARLIDAVRKELQIGMGITASPIHTTIIRWPKAIPQYFVGHLDRVARIEMRLLNFPGLFLGGNAYRGVALNDCTERAEILAKQIFDYFHSSNKLLPTL
ncbi:MAG TPA: protoporphyrinogen oxidase [Gemmataceae bacterium]|nr:protoporphyrinogen oxidase [Gemmataceae bacterium]